ncbi:MAG TPA: DUF6519 domain-containing protein [Pyrinomonadaceae bacterium]|nr:DUF6519 domain-containing protein [Pyrinomonadaceae bacterium]
MKSDITRDTFVAAKNFSRVIRQQGRVDVDADSNEQTSILLHYLRTLAVDLIGPYAAPVLAAGFRLSKDSDESLVISAGRYYVDGILVENNSPCLYTQQPDNPLAEDDAFAKALIDKLDATYWLYLDVWERHITAIEDDSIREKALGGPDTSSRAKVMWQVRALDVGDNAHEELKKKREESLTNKLTALETQLAATDSNLARAKIQDRIDRVKAQLEVLNKPEPDNFTSGCPYPLDFLLPVSDALMGARVDPGAQIVDACVTSPDSKYLGAENQLYRVEVHRGGVQGEATFKWSRDNASVATAWLGTSGHDIEVADARGFAAGNWVELTDDVAELRGIPGVLGRLTKVEAGTLSVDPDSVSSQNALVWSEELVNPKLRRWDHFETEDIVLEDDGSILIQETGVGVSDDEANWIGLEDGIQIRFAEGGEYRAGDYWLIPARVASGNIEWPASESDTFLSLTTQIAPHGVVHHYAPLGFAVWPEQKLELHGCNCEFEPLSSCFAAGSVAVGASLLREQMFAQARDRTARPTAGRTRGVRSTTRTTTRRTTSKKGPGELKG